MCMQIVRGYVGINATEPRKERIFEKSNLRLREFDLKFISGLLGGVCTL